MARVTYSLDDETVATIRRTASRLGKPQSHVVRDAVTEFASRADRLSEAERVRAMAVLERLRGTRPARPVAEVDAELRSLRAARRAGGRRHPAA